MQGSTGSFKKKPLATVRGGHPAPKPESAPASAPRPDGPTTLARGQAAEDLALRHLQRAGLRLVTRNYRVARGPSRHAGEVDLIMHDPDGTLVFVEVRSRARRDHGGAAASITHVKRQRLVRAAGHYLLRCRSTPPCRFDVVAIDGDVVQWLPAAFDAGG